MALKHYNPTSPGRRSMSGATFEELTKVAPEKSLLMPLKKRAGRNSRGVITVRHRGGGAKRKLRIIDFSRNKLGVPGKVASIEYDPNRSARIALIHYVDGEKRYILSPLGLTSGDTIEAGEEVDIKPGNSLPLSSIPVGTLVHNIELEPGKGGQLARSAGNAAQIISKEGKYVLHTLNNTMIATSRAMVAILENYQNKDGSITIPKVLRHYMQGKKKIGPKP